MVVVRRRALFDSALFQVSHVTAVADSANPGAVEEQPENVVVFPLRGVFAKHDAPRRSSIATPSHVAFIAANTPYRVSFPGAHGDECLSLRFSDTQLSRVTAGMEFDRDVAFRARVSALLSPPLLLVRTLLHRRLADATRDAVEIEELGIGLLGGALGSAAGAPDRISARSRAAIAGVQEALALAPERKWSLAELAGLVGLSPYHLARAFRRAVGLPIHRYLLRARLSRTLDPVLSNRRSLVEVALEAGFASHSHFTARFRDAFGVAPGNLRKIVKARAPAVR